MLNTQTNVISSIPDYNIIIKVLSDYSEGKTLDEIKDMMIIGNAYGIRTKSSRVRFYTAINSSFLQFRNADHRAIITAIFSSDLSNNTQRFLAYIQMAINNELFFLLTTDFLMDLLLKGRLSVDKQECISYLIDLKKTNSDEIQWTDETIGTIAYKYLTLMKKIGFLKGARKKEFNIFVPTNEMIVLTVYLLESLSLEYSTFINNPYSSLLMLSKDGIAERLRRLDLQDFIIISTIGNNIKVELKFNYKDIVNEVRKNY